MSYTLVVVDTTQIQPYIFASNRLAENIGASWLVSQATGRWALETVQQVAPRNNITSAANNLPNAGQSIENDDLDAEVIYAAGGNVLVIFKAEESARKFIRALSRRVLREAPGLTLLFASRAFEWAPSQLFNAVQEAFQELERQKSCRVFDAPLLGLGVTLPCRSTGLPATALYTYASDAHQPLSSSIIAKLAAAPSSNHDLKQLLNFPDEYDLPGQLDHLGRSRGEQSFIAVVHSDGNGFGQAMVKLGEQHKDDNRAYINAMRARSEALEKAGREALQSTVDCLLAAIRPHSDLRGSIRFIGDDPMREDTLKLVQQGNKWFLPFRPLVFGGDDNTFVCDGRLGLSLTTAYLKHFAQYAEKELKDAGVLLDGERPSACAGVAIVKTRYPFSRAYHLAEGLCANAKRFRAQESERARQEQGCFLDWHFAFSSLIGGIDEIRRREYEVSSGRLTLRPVSLEAFALDAGASFDARTARSWPVIERLIQDFQGAGWAERRNKVKALRQAVREGPEAVERFGLIYGLGKQRLPALALYDEGEHRDNGWLKDENGKVERCAYFDAIELADLYLPLPCGEEKEAAR